MRQALREHWPEYLIEAAALGIFMISACVFGALLWYPGSPAAQAVPDGVVRRLVMGLAMGGTAILLIYSPWGQRSGAHMNPAFTLTFLRLGRVKPWDAAFYVGAQFLGGLAGVLLAAAVLGPVLADPRVRYVVTAPGGSLSLAFLAEAAMTFIMMTMVLNVTAGPYARLTGLFAGLLVCSYITLEAPISGMSLNPARTFASALPALDFDALWLYFLAPPLGMLAAAELHSWLKRPRPCPKYHHENRQRCIFCGKPGAAGEEPGSAVRSPVQTALGNGLGGGRGDERPLRRDHHRDGSGRRHAAAPAGPDRQEDPGARTRRLRAAGARQLGLAGGQRRGQVQ